MSSVGTVSAAKMSDFPEATEEGTWRRMGQLKNTSKFLNISPYTVISKIF